MGVYERTVVNKRNKEGVSTNRSGKVYDVYIKYKDISGHLKNYTKRGFSTKKEANIHEAEMRIKLAQPNYSAELARKGKQPLEEYLQEWLFGYAENNVRASTYAGYERNIRLHIVPYIGGISINVINGAVLDKLYKQLRQEGMSVNSVKYIHRTLSVSLEHALKYGYINTNPAKMTLTKFKAEVIIPEPYDIKQIRALVNKVEDLNWKLIVVLGGLYGLRRNEVLGLRWPYIDLKKNTISIVEQKAGFEEKKRSGKETAALKEASSRRVLPITKWTKKYFSEALEDHQNKRNLIGPDYNKSDFLIVYGDGKPISEMTLSHNFGKMLEKFKFPHIRFHDLRHSAATNMHQLTGDFYTVGEILGHSMKGIGNTLGLGSNLEAVTERYVDVRLKRKSYVLETYHKQVIQRSKLEREI